VKIEPRSDTMESGRPCSLTIELRNEEPSEVGSGGRLETRDKMSHLGHTVNEYENRVVAIRNRQIGDEIAR